MNVLGIETTCDETGLALYDSSSGSLSHSLYSQVALHAPYGGVVPELASRDHIRRTIPLLRQVLEQSGKNIHDLQGIAYAAGPGLIGAVMVGASFGRSLGFALNIPTIGINHLEAHLLAPFLEIPSPQFPFLALLVSGGHTLLVQVTGLGQYQMLGESIDDAAGEAFDKVAKLLNLPYPGGPALEKCAEQGTPNRFKFPRPMTTQASLNFSFSGLKTHVVHVVHSLELTDQDRADIAYAFQEAVIDTLVIKCLLAQEHTGLRQLVIAGGVSANRLLRSKLTEVMRKRQVEVFYPRLEFCTDNAAMIAYAGAQHLDRGEQEGLSINVHARWPLNTPT